MALIAVARLLKAKEREVRTFIAVVIGLAVIGLGVLEAFFPSAARRLRGLDGQPDENSTKLVDSERYTDSFRFGGALMIGFGAVVLWIVLFK